MSGVPHEAPCAGWLPHPRSKAVDGAWDKTPDLGRFVWSEPGGSLRLQEPAAVLAVWLIRSLREASTVPRGIVITE